MNANGREFIDLQRKNRIKIDTQNNEARPGTYPIEITLDDGTSTPVLYNLDVIIEGNTAPYFTGEKPGIVIGTLKENSGENRYTLTGA